MIATTAIHAATSDGHSKREDKHNQNYQGQNDRSFAHFLLLPGCLWDLLKSAFGSPKWNDIKCQRTAYLYPGNSR